MSKKKTPAIRFKGFTDDWEQCTIENISLDIIAGGDVNKNKLLTRGKYPVIANALTNNGIIGYYNSEYRIKGPALTITGRGDVGYAKARNINFTPVVRLITIKTDHDIYYLENMINNLNIIIESTGVPQLTVPQLKKYKISIPQNINEEKLIGSYNKALDNLITLHQRKCEKLKIFKKAMLKKMFPKNNKKIPEVRFKGFTDAWEQCQFYKIIHTLPFKKFIKLPELSGKYQIIQQGYQPIIGFANGIPCYDYKDTVIFGDHTLSLYKPVQPFFIATDGLKLIKGKEFIYGFYLLMLLETYKPKNEGYKRYYSILTNSNCYITHNNSEQKQIGNFFKTLDNLITLHQRKVEKLQIIKKSMLEKMFV